MQFVKVKIVIFLCSCACTNVKIFFGVQEMAIGRIQVAKHCNDIFHRRQSYNYLQLNP